MADDGVCHSVKCSMVSAEILKERLDADDRLFILHVNAVDGTAKADFGDKAISDEVEQNVHSSVAGSGSETKRRYCPASRHHSCLS